MLKGTTLISATLERAVRARRLSSFRWQHPRREFRAPRSRPRFPPSGLKRRRNTGPCRCEAPYQSDRHFGRGARANCPAPTPAATGRNPDLRPQTQELTALRHAEYQLHPRDHNKIRGSWKAISSQLQQPRAGREQGVTKMCSRNRPCSCQSLFPL